MERVDVAELQESREPAPITAPPLDQNPQAIPSLLINAAGDVVQNQEASRPEPQVEYFKKLTRQEAVSSDVSSEGKFQKKNRQFHIFCKNEHFLKFNKIQHVPFV